MTWNMRAESKTKPNHHGSPGQNAKKRGQVPRFEPCVASEVHEEMIYMDEINVTLCMHCQPVPSAIPK